MSRPGIAATLSDWRGARASVCRTDCVVTFQESPWPLLQDLDALPHWFGKHNSRGYPISGIFRARSRAPAKYRIRYAEKTTLHKNYKSGWRRCRFNKVRRPILSTDRFKVYRPQSPEATCLQPLMQLASMTLGVSDNKPAASRIGPGPQAKPPSLRQNGVDGAPGETSAPCALA
jgi:hypothetical protein